MYKCLLGCGIVLCCAVNGFSQAPSTNYDLPKFLPPSPTAVALARYGDIPVDISTGVPNIEVPLYTIKSRQLEIPLSLSYHASGNRVDDISTPVGLGWVLTGMGLVSRTVLDLADDRKPYWVNTPHKAQYKSSTDYNNALSAATTQAQRVSMATTIIADISHKDKKSDRFNFQLPGNGGGNFRYDFNTDQCVVVPYRAVKISKLYDTSNSTPYYAGVMKEFDITDEKGTKYFFDKAYTTLQGSTTDDIVNTSWYLSKMISADSTDEIDYEYSLFGNGASLLQFNQWVTWKTGVGGCVDNCDPGATIDTQVYFDGQSSNLITTNEPLLTRIKSSTTIVDFSYASDRHDVEGYQYRLSSITISDPHGNVIRKINLDNNVYFGGQFSTFDSHGNIHGEAPVDQSLRLKLRGITITGQGGMPDQVYSFGYNESAILPPYVTATYNAQRMPVFAQDYWGYYNGKDNNSGLIPADCLPCLTPYPASCRTRYKGDRKPNPDMAKAYLINEINYPTGGKTTFEFEPHTDPFSGVIFGGFRIKSIKHYDNVSAVPEVKTYAYINMITKPIDKTIFSHPLSNVDYWVNVPCPYLCASGMTTSDITFATDFTQSSSFSELSLSSGSPVVYTEVSVYNGDAIVNTGKIDYTYSSPIAVEDQLGGDYNSWMLGSFAYDNGPYNPVLLFKNEYKNVNGTYTLISGVSNTYQYFKDETEYSTGVNVTKNTMEYSNISTPGDGGDAFYTFVINKATQDAIGYPGYITTFNYVDTKASPKLQLLTSTIQTDCDDAGCESITTQYTYGNLTHLQPTEELTTNSEGETLHTVLKYPVDFAAGNPVYTKMINRNIITPIIEKQHYKGTKHLETMRSNYYQTGNIIVPQTVESSIGDNPSEIRLHYYAYDDKGNVLEVSKENDIHYSYIWGYDQQYPIAQVANASYKNIFHTSFEDPANANSGAKTGVKAGPSSYTHTLTTLSNGNYLLDYWKWDATNTVWVKVTAPVTVSNSTNGANGTYTININESSNIDEVRFYPAGAQMTTNTYIPLIGVTSTTDAAGETNYFEYDHAGRTSVIKDLNNNILKKIGYSYNGQPEDPIPGAYYNQAAIGLYTRNNCASGYTGVQWVYTVPAWKYSSTISQADADQKAQNDITNNGQVNANLYGTCIPAFTNTQKSQVFIKSNCGSGFTGGSFTYTVYPGTYRATTQTAADQLALNDIAANGQRIANDTDNTPCYGIGWPYVYFDYENVHTQNITDVNGVQHENNYADVTVKFFTDASMTTPMPPVMVHLYLRRDTETSQASTTDYPYVTAYNQTEIVWANFLTSGYDTNGNSVEAQMYLEPGDGYNIITSTVPAR